jgi:EmrB/QacA subfamily drug resistance transporter
VLAACIAASALAMIDGSMVNVGLPAIGRSLHVSGGGLSWAVNGFALPLSALILTGGAVGDRFGRRRMLLIGVAIFAVGCAVCAAAPDLAWLVGGRLLQGAGAALLMPNSLAILGASFDGPAKGRAVGMWAAVTAAAAAGAPLLGGWLIDTVGWRALFLLNLPVAAGAFALAAAFVRDSADAERARLDVSGAVLATAALSGLTYGLTQASARGGFDTAAWAALGVGAACAGGYAWVQVRKGDRAMTPPALFAAPRFVGLSVLTLLLYGALSAVLLLVPYLLQTEKHYDAMTAGAALLPLPILLSVMSPFMGRVAGRIGSRLPLTLGPVIVAVGVLLAMAAPGAGSYWTTLLPAMLVISFGMACAVAPLTTAVLSSVEKAHTGAASGFNSAVARTGGLIATALLGGALSLQGPALGAAFRVICVVCAACALAAGAAAWIGLKPAAKPEAG